MIISRHVIFQKDIFPFVNLSTDTSVVSLVKDLVSYGVPLISTMLSPSTNISSQHISESPSVAATNNHTEDLPTIQNVSCPEFEERQPVHVSHSMIARSKSRISKQKVFVATSLLL